MPLAFYVHLVSSEADWPSFGADIQKQEGHVRVGGNAVVQGTYIQLEDAPTLCNHFGLSLEPITLIKADCDNLR